MKDREGVTKRLKSHVEDKEKLPVLIFPEGKYTFTYDLLYVEKR
jgi:hypothetical protein